MTDAPTTLRIEPGKSIEEWLDIIQAETREYLKPSPMRPRFNPRAPMTERQLRMLAASNGLTTK
jgi:hypothetical protein